MYFADLVRDAPVGQVIRLLSGNRLLQHPEDKADFELPLQYTTLLGLDPPSSEKETAPGPLASSSALDDAVAPPISPSSTDSSSSESAGPARTLADDGDSSSRRRPSTALERLSTLGMVASTSRHYTAPFTAERVAAELASLRSTHRAMSNATAGTKDSSPYDGATRLPSTPIIPRTTAVTDVDMGDIGDVDGPIVLVDWYTTTDPANPSNWSRLRRASVAALICVYTWVVYTGSSIYAPSSLLIAERFGLSEVAASLPLALYVLAYGLGPLLWAPLCEIPAIGRGPVYALTFLVFFAISFPTAASTGGSFAALLVLRFLQGFFGSPALANGGATFGDVYPLLYLPYPLSWWVWAAWGGPSLGFLMAGFAVGETGDWWWGLWEIVWMSAPVVVALLLFLPETSEANILLRRARRLRRRTGQKRLQSASEMAQRRMTAREVLVDALIKPIEITLKDPAIFFVNLYTALFYSIYYTFFEVFPLVFPPRYGFNLGETGLAFLSCQIGATMALLAYFAYLRWYMIPDNFAHGLRAQEHRLVPGIVGSLCIPTGLFIFAWTAKASIHWIVPLIGVVIFVIGTFLILQSIFVYVPLSYPKYAASLFAGNDLTRSAMACGSILYARPLFINLGVDRGVSLLGGISVGGIFGMLGLYYYGAKLRARSTFAAS